MKYLITGSNGLLGQHLVKLLVQNKAIRVVASARGENRLKSKEGYEYLSLDISDRQKVHQVIAAERPDVIIHGAAMTRVDDCEVKKDLCWEVNVSATRYLIEAAQQSGASFLLVSTDFIFDGEAGPYDENALPDPLSFYGLSKLAAEMLVLGSGLNAAIARTVLVYGVAEDLSRSNIVLWVKESLEQGKEIRVVDDQWRTPTLVDDLAVGCKLIADTLAGVTPAEKGKKETGIYNISGGELLTPYEIARKVAAYFNLNPDLIRRADASTFSQAAKRPRKTGFLIEKARRQLQYEPHSFKEALARIAEALKG